MNQRLSLLLALPALTGCGVGLPQLDNVDAEGVATGVVEQEEPESLVVPDEPGVTGSVFADGTVNPAVLHFDVEPAALPLGGGPVLVSWEAQDVADCALVVNDTPAVTGLSGELMVDVAEDADVHLICLDDAQELAAEAQHLVTVVQPPVEAFAPDESFSVAVWEASSAVGRLDRSGEVHEVAVLLPEDGRLVADVSATPDRAQLELWLAADVDGDGYLASEEVLEVVRSSDTGRIDQVLPAGSYSLFVVTVNGAATWHLEMAVSDPDADGTN